jgi:hypothetical protein
VVSAGGAGAFAFLGVVSDVAFVAGEVLLQLTATRVVRRSINT